MRLNFHETWKLLRSMNLQEITLLQVEKVFLLFSTITVNKALIDFLNLSKLKGLCQIFDTNGKEIKDSLKSGFLNKQKQQDLEKIIIRIPSSLLSETNLENETYFKIFSKDELFSKKDSKKDDTNIPEASNFNVNIPFKKD